MWLAGIYLLVSDPFPAWLCSTGAGPTNYNSQASQPEQRVLVRFGPWEAVAGSWSAGGGERKGYFFSSLWLGSPAAVSPRWL